MNVRNVLWPASSFGGAGAPLYICLAGYASNEVRAEIDCAETTVEQRSSGEMRIIDQRNRFFGPEHRIVIVGFNDAISSKAFKRVITEVEQIMSSVLFGA